MFGSRKLIGFGLSAFLVAVCAAEDLVHLSDNEREYLTSVVSDLPKEGWEYSGKGGYLFRFEADVVGEAVSEVFLGSSLKSGSWVVLDANSNLLGKVNVTGLNSLKVRRSGEGVSILESYEISATEKFIREYWITSEGVEDRSRQVASEEDRELYDLLSTGHDKGIETLKIESKFVRLEDALTGSNCQWESLENNKWVLSDGYYLYRDDVDFVRKIKTSSDEKEIQALVGEFTQSKALKLLSGKVSERRERTDRRRNEVALRNKGDGSLNRLQSEERKSKQANGQSRLPWFLAGLLVMGVLFFLKILKGKSTP